jgi:hypothetical protein
MTIASSFKLQNDLKNLMAQFLYLRNEALDLYNLYWKGGVDGAISGLSSGDPASQAARLTKAQLASGLTMADQMGNQFFENGTVTQGDYQTTIQVTLYGNATPTLISVPVEGFANRLVLFARALLTAFNACRDVENFYGAVLFSTIDALPNGTDIVPGSDVTKNDVLAAIALVQQFQKFLQNQVVTSGFYKTTLGQWSRFV